MDTKQKGSLAAVGLGWFPAPAPRLPMTRVPGVCPHPSTPFYQHSPPHQRHNEMNGIESLNHQGHPRFDNKMTNLTELSRGCSKYDQFFNLWKELFNLWKQFLIFRNDCLVLILQKEMHYALLALLHSFEYLIGFLSTVDELLTQSDKIHPSAKRSVPEKQKRE